LIIVRKLFAEWIGAACLLAVVVGSGIMADRLADGLFITAGYWFTSSTSFANPAVTIARTMTETFAGIRPDHAPAFIVAKVIGAVAATLSFRWLLMTRPPSEA